jgi:hypothetical protein
MMSQNIRRYPPSNTSHIPEEWKSKVHHCKSLKTDIWIYYVYVCVCVLIFYFLLSFILSFFLSFSFLLSFSPFLSFLSFFLSFCLSVFLSFFLSFFLSCLLSSLYFSLSFSSLCLIHLIGLDILCFDTVICSWEHLNLPHSIVLDASALYNCTDCCLAKIHNKGSSFSTCK